MTTEQQDVFDAWANDYDSAVDSGSSFPFAGYAAVLSTVVRYADVEAPHTVLDVGTGTGNLAQRFAPTGCTLWGIDFSDATLEQACRKVPEMQRARRI